MCCFLVYARRTNEADVALIWICAYWDGRTLVLVVFMYMYSYLLITDSYLFITALAS